MGTHRRRCRPGVGAPRCRRHPQRTPEGTPSSRSSQGMVAGAHARCCHLQPERSRSRPQRSRTGRRQPLVWLRAHANRRRPVRASWRRLTTPRRPSRAESRADGGRAYLQRAAPHRAHLQPRPLALVQTNGRHCRRASGSHLGCSQRRCPWHLPRHWTPRRPHRPTRARSAECAPAGPRGAAPPALSRCARPVALCIGCPAFACVSRSATLSATRPPRPPGAQCSPSTPRRAAPSGRPETLCLLSSRSTSALHLCCRTPCPSCSRS